MESNKFALLFVAMAAMILLATAPAVTAARNKINPFAIVVDANIRNPLANIFFAKNCIDEGEYCGTNSECCSGRCVATDVAAIRLCD
ncbi:hypothetical protein V6N13_033113 [Hibiscus sabdariffa]